jgi:hypothetical protein
MHESDANGRKQGAEAHQQQITSTDSDVFTPPHLRSETRQQGARQ